MRYEEIKCDCGNKTFTIRKGFTQYSEEQNNILEIKCLKCGHLEYIDGN